MGGLEYRIVLLEGNIAPPGFDIKLGVFDNEVIVIGNAVVEKSGFSLTLLSNQKDKGVKDKFIELYF